MATRYLGEEREGENVSIVSCISFFMDFRVLIDAEKGLLFSSIMCVLTELLSFFFPRKEDSERINMPTYVTDPLEKRIIWRYSLTKKKN